MTNKTEKIFLPLVAILVVATLCLTDTTTETKPSESGVIWLGVCLLGVLTICFSVIGTVAAFMYIKRWKKQINRPYIFGLKVTGVVGAFAIAITTAILSSDYAGYDTLAASIMACCFATGAIIATVVSGVVVGKIISDLPPEN